MRRRALLAGLLLVAAFPSSADARLSFAITGARCVPPESCTSGRPHDVPPGGKLALRGRGLKRGMLVIFKRGSGRTITSKIRRSKYGSIVTVPPLARSGRIRVVSGRRRTNAFGPIRVVKPPPSPIQPQASGTSFDGSGMWIWYVDKSEGGSLDAIAARANAAGVRTVFVKSGDGTTYWTQFSPLLVGGLKQRGLNVCAWQFVYGKTPEDEAAVAARAVQTGAQCFVIDAETQYEGKYGAAQTYMRALRASVPPGYPIALTSFPYVDYHPALPYSVFLGPGAADFNQPQVYWKDIGDSVDVSMQHTYVHNRIYERPVFPLGQSYSDPAPSEMERFRRLAPLYGSSGVSWWSWQASTERGWTAIGKQVEPLTDYTPSQDMPLLAKGKKGDEVLWMQEHLKTADPSTPTSGNFDAATDTALRNFQAQHGLAINGQTDAPTWQALLALEPAAVDWTTTPPAFASAARTAKSRREKPVLSRH